MVSRVTAHPLLPLFSSLFSCGSSLCWVLLSVLLSRFHKSIYSFKLYQSSTKKKKKKIVQVQTERPLTITHTHTHTHTHCSHINTGQHCCLKVIRKRRIIFYSAGISLTLFSVAQVFGSDKQLSFTPTRCVCLSACVRLCVCMCVCLTDLVCRSLSVTHG